MQAGWILDLDFELDPVSRSGSQLKLNEQAINKSHITSGRHLGDNDSIDVISGRMDHVYQISIAPSRGDRIDPKNPGMTSPVVRLQRRNNVCPGSILALRRDRIL